MTSKTLLARLGALSLLAACGDGTSFQDDAAVVVGAASFADDIYTVTQGGEEIALNITESTTINGQRVWLTAGADRAQVFEADDILAIGGISADGVPFAGLGGTPVAAPSADATYTGAYGVLSGEDTYAFGDLELIYAFEDATLTSNGGNLSVAATVAPEGIAGTVTFSGETATLAGAFHGTDGLAGAFVGDTIGGVINATAQ